MGGRIDILEGADEVVRSMLVGGGVLGSGSFPVKAKDWGKGGIGSRIPLVWR